VNALDHLAARPEADPASGGPTPLDARPRPGAASVPELSDIGIAHPRRAA
jgi:hypothetical protein